MRIIFLGSGEFGIPTLRQLHADYEVAAVITQPDRPAGRKRQMTATPVAGWADEHKLPVIKTQDANGDGVIRKVRSLEPDAAVVIAFGQKLSPDLIGALGGLVINLHASLLPKYRGAAPINWALIDGEPYTGVSVIGLAQRMDAGVVYARVGVPIQPDETAGELHDRLALMGPDVVSRVLDHYRHDKLQPQAQNDADATKAPKLSKADAYVEFAQSAEAVRNRIHGLNPWPGVKATINGRDIALRRAEAVDIAHDASPGTVLDDLLIACGSGAVRLIEVQPPGKRPMTLTQFANGHPVQPGDVMTSP